MTSFQAKAPSHDADVAIVGAGPVGLTLAMVLARHGIRSTILEMRARGEPPNVKCNHVAARSMEIFRSLGIVRRVRDAGLPPDYPNDISYRTAMLGTELARIPIPCRRDRYSATGGPDTWWPTPEPPHRINQIFLEPILLDQRVRACTGVIAPASCRSSTGFEQRPRRRCRADPRSR